MRVRRRPFLLLLGAIAFGFIAPRIAHAALDGFHVTLEPWGGYMKWAKNINYEGTSVYGGTLGLHFHRYVGIEGFVGRTTPNGRHGPTIWSQEPSTAPPVGNEILLYGANLIVHLRPSAVLTPFLTGGWQEGKIEPDDPSTPEPIYENGFQVGGGLQFRPWSRIAIRADVRDLIWQFSSPPAPDPPGEDATDNLMFTAGLQFAFGGSSRSTDSDSDGVPDHRDKCPGTPLGARVDANGCPTDADADGVPDGIDQCADTPRGATVDARGCPTDEDSDRVWNGIDECPNTPAGAVVDARGCPVDTDRDGVPDGIDQCADTPSGVAVDARGCPRDADNDGVADDKDLCPNTPANTKVDKDGCPITLSDREIELLDKGRITERQIHFETAKWDILPESFPTLDAIGNILIQWPRLRIEIGGHADHRGSDAYNLDLSQKRSESVMSYLLDKFPQLDRANFTARGYGERQPVASNRTVEGMAQNRRVEFKVLNTEELKKERERRRTLQEGD